MRGLQNLDDINSWLFDKFAKFFKNRYYGKVFLEFSCPHLWNALALSLILVLTVNYGIEIINLLIKSELGHCCYL